ncbi:substrate-binding domain-containing protein [Clostridium algoriphilum]|uniref:substrate-binding domain-containing protein n=1 Tax=Clostridium algoriphilum TaxID=198347 RepID=UPI001CF5F2D6|nr:substrate-binding domain-containing protein [Clostridium algoriphilum]MCB2292259.1 substrate-binding domain-containing protein [Clostridium algoriphilum]
MKKKKLRTYTLFFCIIMIMINVGCKKDTAANEEKPKSIKIVCEDSVLPMVKDLARDYNLNNDSVVTVESDERESAFNKLNESTADTLVGYVQKTNKEVESEKIAYDAIGVIVNTSNKVNGIGTLELKKIYTGSITNWGKLNGESKTIVPVAYKDNFNSVEQEFSMQIKDTPVKEQMSNSIQYVSSVEEMNNFVAQNKNAIGFIPGQWYNKENKLLTLSGIEMTASNIKNKLYVLRFPIKMYYSKEKVDSLKDLFQYLKSEDGKKIIRKYCIEAF